MTDICCYCKIELPEDKPVAMMSMDPASTVCTECAVAWVRKAVPTVMLQMVKHDPWKAYEPPSAIGKVMADGKRQKIRTRAPMKRCSQPVQNPMVVIEPFEEDDFEEEMDEAEDYVKWKFAK